MQETLHDILRQTSFNHEMSPLLGIIPPTESEPAPEAPEQVLREISYIQGFFSSERVPRRELATRHRGLSWVKVVAAQMLFD